MFQTEFEFTLPCGYLDEDGTLHRDGVMRRATAADEILPLKDPRVIKNPAYLVVILLSRVVTRLGGVAPINPEGHRGLYATDLAYPAGPLQRDQPPRRGPGTDRLRHCQQEVPRPVPGRGDMIGYPLELLARGGGLRRLPLPLAPRGGDGARARR